MFRASVHRGLQNQTGGQFCHIHTAAECNGITSYGSRVGWRFTRHNDSSSQDDGKDNCIHTRLRSCRYIYTKCGREDAVAEREEDQTRHRTRSIGRHNMGVERDLSQEYYESIETDGTVGGLE